jgi:hypothetical protein
MKSKSREDLIGFIWDTVNQEGGFFETVRTNNSFYGSLEKDLDFMNGLYAENKEIGEVNNYTYKKSGGRIKKITLEDLKNNNLLMDNGEIDYRIIIPKRS